MSLRRFRSASTSNCGSFRSRFGRRRPSFRESACYISFFFGRLNSALTKEDLGWPTPGQSHQAHVFWAQDEVIGLYSADRAAVFGEVIRSGRFYRCLLDQAYFSEGGTFWSALSVAVL
jgi:hypothetical protein